jgi:hypothetical protein
MTAIERRNPCESLAAVDWSREHVGAVLMQKGKGCAPSHASLRPTICVTSVRCATETRRFHHSFLFKRWAEYLLSRPRP